MKVCMWYHNDILIYGSNTKSKYQGIVEKVLQQFVEHQLAVKLLKSEFHIHETIFLGHVVNGQEVKVNSTKLDIMSQWPIWTKKKKVQTFLVFANYYHQYIVNYSAKARPLIHLTNDVPFK